MKAMVDARALVQMAYIVPNLEAACAEFHRIYGIGPFVGGEGVGTLDAHVYRGRPAPPIRIRGVFVQSGDLNIELIELVSPPQSAFHDMADGGARPVLHHVALFCDDYEAQRDDWIAEGYAIASEFTTGFGAKICYVDTRAAMGHMIELYPENETIRTMYRATRDAAETWDGRDLIVPWSQVLPA